MRIDPKVLVPITTERKPGATADAATAARSNATATAEAAASGAPAASVVKLSSAGAAVQSGGTGEKINTRLQQIRAMLDKGEYPVDLDSLAARIVDDEFARAGTRSGGGGGGGGNAGGQGGGGRQ